MEHLVDSCERDAVNTEDQPSLVDVSFPQEKSEKIDILDVNLSQEGSDNNFRREETSQTECSHSVLQHNTPSVFPAQGLVLFYQLKLLIMSGFLVLVSLKY